MGFGKMKVILQILVVIRLSHTPEEFMGLGKFLTVDFLSSSVIKRQQDRKHSGRQICQARSMYCRLSHYFSSVMLMF